MNKFRIVTPKRQEIKIEVSKYHYHKENLRIDFGYKCGYCNDHEIWRNSFYEIDHFIPKAYLSDKEKTEYWNLVYSCRFCNNSKRAKWPTNDRSIHNNGSVGFIDPCSIEYDEQFERDDFGRIIPTKELGKWMFENLNLGLKRHAIIWQLVKLDETIDLVENLFPNIKNQEIKDKITNLLFLYRRTIKDWQLEND